MSASHNLGRMFSVIFFFLILKAEFPEAQQRFYEEVVQVIGPTPDVDRPSMEDLNEMSYVSAFVKESQRLYPISHVHYRDVKEALDLGGIYVNCFQHLQTSLQPFSYLERTLKSTSSYVFQNLELQQTLF